MEKKKVLEVLGTEVIDAGPETPRAPIACLHAVVGAPVRSGPENEVEVRDFLVAAIEFYAEMVEVPCPGTHFGPERRFFDSRGIERSMIVRFGEQAFEIRIMKSEACNEGI